MNISRIINLIEDSNLTKEEKKNCINEITSLYKAARREAIRNVLLLEVSTKLNGKRKTKKMEKMCEALEVAVNKPKEIVFKKFDLEEMKNPIIRTAVIKNIIGAAQDFSNFVCWNLLKGCLNLLEKSNYSKDISGMISLMSDLYYMTTEDLSKETDKTFDYLNKHCDLDESILFRPFCGLTKDRRKEKVLFLLNRLKEYKNTGGETYTVMYQT